MSAIAKRFRKMTKSIVPGLVANVVRTWKWRIEYARGFLAARRQFGETSRVADVLALVRSRIRPPRTILFYPELPTPMHLSFRLCAVLGFLMTADFKHDHDIAFKRQGATIFDAALLDDLPIPRSSLINGSSLDVSKRHVGEVYESVFGRPIDVDPTRYDGLMVEKSNKNATHDGRLVNGPIPKDAVSESCVYERAINNASVQLDIVLDYRVPVHGDIIPLVYLKYRHYKNRFSNTNLFVEVAEPDEVFSAEERDRLLRFAREMGIDFGELDVLRDADGEIYVVDAANTPGGPPNGLSDSDARRVVARLARSFDQLTNGAWLESARQSS